MAGNIVANCSTNPTTCTAAGGIGGVVSSVADMVGQVLVTGGIRPGQTTMATVSGAILKPVLGSAVKGENPNAGMAGAAAGSVVGYKAGGALEKGVNAKVNPWYRQEWADTGFGVSKYIPPSVLPSLLGTSLGAAGSEVANGSVSTIINPPPKKDSAK